MWALKVFIIILENIMIAAEKKISTAKTKIEEENIIMDPKCGTLRDEARRLFAIVKHIYHHYCARRLW